MRSTTFGMIETPCPWCRTSRGRGAAATFKLGPNWGISVRGPERKRAARTLPFCAFDLWCGLTIRASARAAGRSRFSPKPSTVARRMVRCPTRIWRKRRASCGPFSPWPAQSLATICRVTWSWISMAPPSPTF